MTRTLTVRRAEYPVSLVEQARMLPDEADIDKAVGHELRVVEVYAPFTLQILAYDDLPGVVESGVFRPDIVLVGSRAVHNFIGNRLFRQHRLHAEKHVPRLLQLWLELARAWEHVHHYRHYLIKVVGLKQFVKSHDECVLIIRTA